MKDYFELQIALLNRKIKEAGLNPLFGYALSLTAFILLSEYIFNKTGFAKYVVILTCLSLLFKLSEKKRIDFLRSTFGDKVKLKIRVIENFIICAPFLGILVYKSLLFEAGVLFLSSLILALAAFHSNFNLTLPTPFSKKPYEFSTGFRKTFFIFPIAYALTIIAISVDNLNLGIFAFLLVFLTTISYYQKPEQDYYVWIYKEMPKVFLKNKVFNASKNATFLVAPIIIILLIFYPDDFDLILLFFIIGLLFLCAVILAKYSAYPEQMNLPEGMIIAFSLYMPPLLLAVIPFFYSKLIKKLKHLLHD